MSRSPQKSAPPNPTPGPIEQVGRGLFEIILLIFPFSILALFDRRRLRIKKAILKESSTAIIGELNEVIVEVSTARAERETMLRQLEEANRSLQDRNSELADKSQKLEMAYFELESKSRIKDAMSELVASVKGSSDQASREIEEVERGVHELSAETDQIKSIMEKVSEISDKTNHLALNATIEASRAGEHGKGFSVVAEEVKQLANQSKQTISGVSRVVSSIVGKSDHSLKLIEGFKKNLARMDESVSEIHGQFEDLVTTVEKKAELEEEPDLELF